MTINYTPNYHLAKPDTLTEKNVWGTPLNTNWDIIDSALKVLGGFASRSAFVIWAATATPTVGMVLSDGKVSYIYDNVSVAITDLPGWAPFGPVYPDHFKENITPGTTDMHDAIVKALAFGQCNLLSANYATASKIAWNSAALVGTSPNSNPNSELIGLSAFMPIGDAIVAPGRTSRVFGISISYDTLTGTETQGQRVGLDCRGLSQTLQRGAVVDQIKFDNCGTFISDYGTGTFSVTWGSMELKAYSYRAVDLYGTSRTGDTWLNVYVNGNNVYTPESGFCLTGQQSGGFIGQLNVEHTPFTGYPVRFEGCIGLEIASLHIEGDDIVTAGHGYIRVVQSDIAIESCSVINTRMSADNTSIFSFGQAGFVGGAPVATPFSRVKLDRFQARGLASPDNTKYPTYPIGRTGIRNIPGFSVFARDLAFTDSNFIVEVSDYMYGAYTAQAADKNFLLHPEIDYVGSIVFGRFTDRGKIINNGENLVQNSLFDRWVSASVTAGISSVTETAETWNIRNGNAGSVILDQVAEVIGSDNSYIARATVTAGHFQSFDTELPFPQEHADQPFLLLFDMKADFPGRVFEQLTATLQNPNGTPTSVVNQIATGSNALISALATWKRHWVEFTGWASAGVTLGVGATVRLAFKFNDSSSDRSPVVSLRNIRLLKLSSGRPMRVPFDRMAGRTLFPRMTTAQRTALINISNGYAVYDVTVPGLYVMDAGTWKKATLV